MVEVISEEVRGVPLQAWTYCASGNRLVAHTWSPSSRSNGMSAAGCSSSGWGVSSVLLGKGLVLQALMLASSFFKFRLSVLTSSLHPMQH